MAVVVTVAKGYDLDYVWKNQGQPGPEQSTGGYYINAAQAGEPPGRWWGPGAAMLGLVPGQVVERKPYEAVYEQIEPHTGAKLGRLRGSYAKFTDHLASCKPLSRMRPPNGSSSWNARRPRPPASLLSTPM
jgi:hypothetical protein